MKLYRTTAGIFAEQDNNYFAVPNADWDSLIARDNLADHLASLTNTAPANDAFHAAQLFAPIGSQEVWAAGVTYYRSRSARMEESKDAGGGSFYDRVYSADRPELFFKSAGWHAVGPGTQVRIRRDAKWSVPEPELTLVINPRGKIIGLTCGNDMSSRDIEGENPLYLPQAKVYNGSCALGPCVLLAATPLDKSTTIAIEIVRGGATVFCGNTTLAELKRDPDSLVEFLYRELSFPTGAYLMTGTGIVPPDAFTLAPTDEIAITIQGIGTLRNIVSAM